MLAEPLYCQSCEFIDAIKTDASNMYQYVLRDRIVITVNLTYCLVYANIIYNKCVTMITKMNTYWWFAGHTISGNQLKHKNTLITEHI